MYLHSKDSLSLLKGIMTVQEELEKFQKDFPSKDATKSSRRDSKVFAKVHRLSDPPKSRTPQDESYRTSRNELHSKRSEIIQDNNNSMIYGRKSSEKIALPHHQFQPNSGDFFSNKIIQRSLVKRDDENRSPKSFRNFIRKDRLPSEDENPSNRTSHSFYSNRPSVRVTNENGIKNLDVSYRTSVDESRVIKRNSCNVSQDYGIQSRHYLGQRDTNKPSGQFEYNGTFAKDMRINDNENEGSFLNITRDEPPSYDAKRKVIRSKSTQHEILKRSEREPQIRNQKNVIKADASFNKILNENSPSASSSGSQKASLEKLLKKLAPKTKEKPVVEKKERAMSSQRHSKSFTAIEPPEDDAKKKKSKQDKAKLLKILVELKNQIHERDLEILELRNQKVTGEIENKELKSQLNDLLRINKNTEDSLGKLNHQLECQENEIEFLKKCKQRLEESSKQQNKANVELKDYIAKVNNYEVVIEEKNQEINDLTVKLKNFQLAAQSLENKNIEMLNEQLVSKDAKILGLQKELEESAQKMGEYKLILTKFEEVEDLQNKLIEENAHLKKQTNEQQIKIIDLETQARQQNKEELTSLLLTNKKLKEIEDFTKKLMLVMEANIKGEELPIELVLQHNRRTQESLTKHQKMMLQNELKDSTIKSLTSQNLALTEDLNKCYVKYMDKICELYAVKYGNECNLQ